MADDHGGEDGRGAAGPVLAGTDRTLGEVGLGTWAWGDRATWGMGGYDTGFGLDTIREAWDASLAAGVRLIDTAEVYGSGESERIIGRLLAETSAARRADVVLATKFMPAPWKLNVRGALRSALVASLGRLGVEAVDLYQLHGPVSLRSSGALADALADVLDDGLTRAVGVSNYSEREMAAIDDRLRRRGHRLATNQVEFSLLRRRPESTGLLRACAARGVVVLAYSPLGQGRLTGKYSAASPPPPGRNFSDHDMALVDPLVAELRRLGERRGRSPGQVALNWIVAKGAVPIPGAKDRAQAEENAGGGGWALDAGEVAELDRLALDGRRALRHRVWQHG